MPHQIFVPEGAAVPMPQNVNVAEIALEHAADTGEILYAAAVRCDENHNLVLDFGGLHLEIMRAEADLGVKLEKMRDIAILSRVGRQVCFAVQKIGGQLLLSRAEAQRRAFEWHMQNSPIGGIIEGKITHMEPFGVFVDIGCGAVSFIGVENISVSRIAHPNQRFLCGQSILAAVLDKDTAENRITLTHRELLGTWEQNAARVSVGSTMRGIVRSIKPYGAFIELEPNLSGLSESREGLRPGDGVSVYIKSVCPSAMKIKLAVIDRIEAAPESRISQSDYFITCGRLNRWKYSPDECAKTIERVFVQG